MRSLRDCWAKRQFEESIRPRPREVISLFITAKISIFYFPNRTNTCNFYVNGALVGESLLLLS